MNSEKLKVILMSMQSSVSMAQKKLDGFAADLKKDPVHAFEWGSSSMEAAATLDIYTSVIKSLTKKGATATPESVYKYAMEQVMNKARYPARGSSPTSNLMHTLSLSVWTQVAELFDPAGVNL